MISRDILPELLRAAAEYPVVTILGPRQSGKTTLARTAFPGKPYYSLEEAVLYGGEERFTVQGVSVFNLTGDDDLWQSLTR